MRFYHLLVSVLIVVPWLEILLERRAHAQQNLFNVPSSEITHTYGVFFQQQLNFLPSARVIESNTNVAVGLPRGFEVGLNALLVNVDLDPRRRGVLIKNYRDPEEPHSPLVVASAQKVFYPHVNFNIGIGTQTGVSVGGPTAQHTRLATLSYLNFVGILPDPEHNVRFVLGAYVCNAVFCGRDSWQAGCWAGLEARVIPNRLNILADCISGNNALAVGVIGINLFFTESLSVVLGPRIPTPGSDNDWGFVVELNAIDVFVQLGLRKHRPPSWHR